MKYVGWGGLHWVGKYISSKVHNNIRACDPLLSALMSRFWHSISFVLRFFFSWTIGFFQNVPAYYFTYMYILRIYYPSIVCVWKIEGSFSSILFSFLLRFHLGVPSLEKIHQWKYGSHLIAHGQRVLCTYVMYIENNTSLYCVHT